MTFVESISTCFKKYADFNGRASRSEFWWWVLFMFLATAALGILSPKLSALFNLATLLPYLAVGARRLHDTDKSGWLQLLLLIPFVGLVLMIVFCAQPPKEPNRYNV